MSLTRSISAALFIILALSLATADPAEAFRVDRAQVLDLAEEFVLRVAAPEHRADTGRPHLVRMLISCPQKCVSAIE
jgi:hypothetical protein